MDTIVDQVVTAAGRYEGTGDGTESGPFTAVLAIEPLLGGMGATIDYVATGSDGAVLHTEHTVLALDMWSGEPTLYVLCPELSGLGELVQVGDATFDNGRDVNGLQLRIDLLVGAGTIEYVWWWGPPGEAPVERSRAVLTRA